MNISQRTASGIAALVFAFAADPASAMVIVSSSVGGAPTGIDYVNFDNLAIGHASGISGGLTVSFTGDGGVVQGSAAGLYAAPYLSNNNGTPFGSAFNGADATRYLSTGVGTVTIQLPGLSNYLGLLWGSVDTYNSLELLNGSTLVGTIIGTNVTSAANGDQGANGTYYVNINSDVAFNTIELLSTQYAFEVDNIAYNPTSTRSQDNPVPEPSSLALIAAGLGALGGLAWLRKQGWMLGGKRCSERPRWKQRDARDPGVFFQARRPHRDRPRTL